MKRNFTLFAFFALCIGIFALLSGKKALFHPASNIQNILFVPREPLPTLTMLDAKGASVKLQPKPCRLTLVLAWAPWCPSCHEVIKKINSLAHELAESSIDIWPIANSIQGIKPVQAFYKNHEINTLDIYVDSSNALKPLLQVPGLPTVYLVDHQGQVFAVIKGAAPWLQNDAINLIKQELEALKRG